VSDALDGDVDVPDVLGHHPLVVVTLHLR
jgi:hypothetical protein